GRSRERHTRMIVIENVSPLVLRINRAADAPVSWAEITVRHIRRQRRHALLYSAATPRAVLPVCGDYHPLFPQWMPSLFPGHKFILTCVICGQARSSYSSVQAES